MGIYERFEGGEKQLQQRVGQQIAKLDIAEGPLEVGNNEFTGY